MSNLKARIEKLEARTVPCAVLIALAERGETITEATERSARAWRRPVETFPVKLVLDFHGGAAKL
jgi:hypothetical protein